MMKSTFILPIVFLMSINLSAEPVRNIDDYYAELHRVEKKILAISINMNIQMMALSEYKNLKIFCQSDSYRATIFNLLEEIHLYHDILEDDLQKITYNHSKRTIKRMLAHMDKLDRHFNYDAFTDFFSEQCSFQSRIEKHSTHYSAGFATHSYGGKVYAQEVVMYRYLNRLTKRVEKIRKHVERFHIRRKVWEH